MILRFAAISMLVLMTGTSASADTSCHAKALRDLKQLAPEGYAIYTRTVNKPDFLHWVTCDDVQLGLTTAVHETVHLQTEELNAYPLITGERLPRVAEGRTFFPPRLIASKFDPESMYVSTYLMPGAASSAGQLRYLLDEFNAYAHDLNAAVKLQAIADPGRDVYHRDGLAALMSFVAAYVEDARARYPATWAELQKPLVKKTVVGLWTQAERVMSSSCRSPRIGLEAPLYLSKVCSATIKHGLAVMLGRPPVCPIGCTAEPQTAQARD